MRAAILCAVTLCQLCAAQELTIEAAAPLTNLEVEGLKRTYKPDQP